MNTTTAHQQPLDAGDLAVLLRLRRMLGFAAIFLVIMALLFSFILELMIDAVGSMRMSDDATVPVLLGFAAAGLLGLIVYTQARNVVMMRQLWPQLRHPQRAFKTVRRGRLDALLHGEGAIRYVLDGQEQRIWLPLIHANTGNVEFRKTVSDVSGLTQQMVELELFELAGAPAPLLLRASYVDRLPRIAERASTAEECAEVAEWDFVGVQRFGAILFYLVALLGVSLLTGPIGALVWLLFGAALLVWLRWRAKRRVVTPPRTLTVTGVIAEVLDCPVSIGRTTERQRWYRIGDRLYPSGRQAKNDGIVCGSGVRMAYVDRGERGGRILRIELAPAP